MLNQDQINHFHQKGWVGPLDIFSATEIKKVKDCLETNSRLVINSNGQKFLNFYNNVLNSETPGHLHLFHRPIMDFFKSPNLIEIIRQIVGNDILFWYTYALCKMPGQGTIKWHQATEYYTDTDIDYQKKTLVYHPDEEPINLSIWVALDDVNMENGCMRFANGSHQKTFTILPASCPASEGVFAGMSQNKDVEKQEEKYVLSYDFDEKEWEIENVPVKAGQTIIFTEKIMHSSFPNNSARPRPVIIGRYVHPSTKVYPHRWQGDFIDENGRNIKRHYCTLVSGVDRYGYNLIKDWHDLDEIETEFQENLNRVRFGQVKIPEDQQLKIYGLEKQALEGDCQEPQPDSISHPYPYIQWQSWYQYRGISAKEAMIKYSQLVATFTQKAVSVSADKHKPIKTPENVR